MLVDEMVDMEDSKAWLVLVCRPQTRPRYDNLHNRSPLQGWHGQARVISHQNIVLNYQADVELLKQQ